MLNSSVLGDENTKRIRTVEDIPNLIYTEKVEYPPAWTIGRKCVNDYKVDKYTIPARSIILMSQHVMH
jgi:hypothetical protein